MPAGAQALIWRVVLDPRIPDGLTDVRRWCLDDVVHAHVFLNQLDELTARQEAASRAKVRG